MSDALSDLFDPENPPTLQACIVECADCGWEFTAYCVVGMNPDVRLECACCGSRNTERMIGDLGWRK